ncbi:MAG: EamA family transporter [Pseudazoarcus pumilus]|nr:EamA family transporter [Pseudazoarcus pumilus]
MTLALAAIVLAVLMHVTWNLLARRADPRSDFLWWGLAGHLVLVGPWSVWVLVRDAAWSPALITALVVTMCANSAYFLGLRAAYRRAPVALVYPVARSSPLLIAVWSVLFFGESLSGLGWVGILVSVMGLLWLAGTARSGEPRAALPWALLAALATSVYSLSNKVAVPALPGFASLLGWVSLAFLASWCVLSVANLRATGHIVPGMRPPWCPVLAASVCIGLGYAPVIHALKYLPAAYVLAFLNMGLVLATLLSIFLFGERTHWRARLAAVSVIAAGIVCVGLAR